MQINSKVENLPISLIFMLQMDISAEIGRKPSKIFSNNSLKYINLCDAFSN
jgi:hypothetical protein